MASIQQATPTGVSPAVQAARAVQGRAANYARHHLQVGRTESASSPAPPQARNGTNVRRAPFGNGGAEGSGVQLSSSYTGGSSMRAYRHSSHGAGTGASAGLGAGGGSGDKYSSNGAISATATALGAAPAYVPLSRHQSIQSQPYGSRTPGPATPSMRARMRNGNRPSAIPPSLAHTLSMSSAPTASPTRGSILSSSAASINTAAALPADDVLCKIFGSCLPTVFEALAKYQYHQATSVLDAFNAEQEAAGGGGGEGGGQGGVGGVGGVRAENRDVRLEWKSWPAFAVMVKLAASCESSYHLMKYLDPAMIQTETLDTLYNKLVVLLQHLADEIVPVVRRAQQRSGGFKKSSAMNTPVAGRGDGRGGVGGGEQEGGYEGYGGGRNATGSGAYGGGGVHSITSDAALLSELEQLTTEDLEYYHGLLDQASEFFALRVSMIGLYRGLATQPSPHNYAGMAKTLERLIKRYSQFEHPLLVTLRQSTIEELRTVKAAFESEVCLAQYDFTKAMLALHRFKASLRTWSDHIDSVTEYPLFDESDDDGHDRDQDDDVDVDADYYLLSSSTYSNATSTTGSSTLQMQQQAAAAAALLYSTSATTYSATAAATGDPHSELPTGAPPLTSTGSLSRPQRESSFRRKSFNQSLATAADLAAFTAASEQAAAASAAMAVPEPSSQNPFSRLRGSLLTRGLSVSSLKSKIQAAAASMQQSSTPTNTLEHAILGTTPSIGLASSMLTPGGNALSSVGTNAGGGGTSGFNTTNAHTLAAEMMASAVAKQEREDGYALPVYQWSKRFCRSLVAKFTLYFHRWLEPFELRGDAISPYDLTRFIRSPVGISYLQLIDVLLAKGSHRVEDGSLSVMLILETDKLDNKGAKFYANGYFCPQFSNRASTAAAHKCVGAPSELLVAKAQGQGQGQPVSGTSAKSTSRLSSSAQHQQHQHTATTTATASPSASNPSHNLFNLNLEPEPEDETGDFASLWGLRGWPAVFCYPRAEPPMEHWPNLVSLIMDNRQVLEMQSGRAPLVHTERRLKTSYYISSVDPAVYLVLLLEGKRRPTEKTVQDFMHTMVENLQHSGVYRRGGVASSRGG